MKVIKAVIFGAILIFIISFISLYSSNEKAKIFFDKYVFRKEVYEENLPTINLDGIETTNIYSYSNYIFILNQNKLSLYNKYGNEEASLDVEISVPIFNCNGKYLCIAEKEGQKIYLISNKNIVWQKEIEGNISDVNVNENGYVSISISGTSYKTVVDTFNANGEELFKTYLSDTNVIDTEISKDNKYLAIAEANFSGITIESSVKEISIEKAQKNSSDCIAYLYNADANNLIINLKYQNKNKIMCMYDSKINYIQDSQNNNFSEINIQDTLFTDINLNGKTVKVVKKSTGLFTAEADIQIIDIDSQNVFTYSINDLPKEIYTNNNNIIAVNMGTKALFINNSGWLIKKYNSEQEIEKIVTGDNIAGVISKGNLKIISL